MLLKGLVSPFLCPFRLGVTLGVTFRGYNFMKLGVTLGVTKPLFLVCARDRKPDEKCKQTAFLGVFAGEN